jgi:DNA-binding transcriptional ArsR family regulator
LRKISIHYDKYTWLPESLIQDAIDRKWEVSLSYFIRLRNFYNNNTFYNFTYRSISEKTGIPYAVLYRHLKRLQEKGLVRVHNGNLTLVGTEKLKKQWGKRITPIRKAENKQSTILNIQFTRILNNLHTQHYVAVKKDEIKQLQNPSFLNAKKAKTLIKARKKLNNESAINDYYMLSNQKFGSLNNRSKSTGLKIQKKMNAEGLLTSKRNIEKYSEEKFNIRAFYNLCLPSNYQLSSKGFIFKVLPNKIKVNQMQ